MQQLMRWVLFGLIIYLISLVSLEIIQVFVIGHTSDLNKDTGTAFEVQSLQKTISILRDWAQDIGKFLSPLVQFGLVVFILLWAVERIYGAEGLKMMSTGAERMDGQFNIQSFIAIIVVIAFSISALTGVGAHVGDLKDIALVVVGFYFGTRRRQADVTADAAAAGAAAGAAVIGAASTPAPPTRSEPPLPP